MEPVPRSTAPVLVTALAAPHKPLIAKHLEALSAADRHLRFGMPMNGSALRRYVDDLDFERDVLLGAMLGNRLVGFGHLGLGGEPEFGLSLLPAARGRGIGTLLLAHAAGVARRHGASYIVMHYLPENQALARLARRAGMGLTIRDGEGRARLSLPPMAPDAALALAVRDASGSMDLALRLAPTPFTSA